MSTTEQIPSSEEVSTLSSRTSRSHRSANEEDVAATRHLRLMISSIAENTSLTLQQRQERICNFEKLLEEAEHKLHFNGDMNDDALMLNSDIDGKRRGRINAPKAEKGKNTSPKKSFMGRFRRKSKTKNSNADEIEDSIDRNSELETLVEERQDEVQVQESQSGPNIDEPTEESRQEAPKEQSGQQPNNIYIPVAPVPLPPPQDDDEVTHTDSIIDVRIANSEDYTASICSIRSLGTFEKDFINNIITEQQAMEEISVSTFEQDAGLIRGANMALPTEVGVQQQQQVEDDDDLTLDLDAMLSETTFEKDARDAAMGAASVRPVQVAFSNDNAVMLQEEDNNDDDDLSETTFEQDHRTVMTEMVSQPDLQAARSEGSIRSVSTFEKDAAARAALAVKIGRIPSTKPKVIEEVSSEGTFEKDHRVRQALSQRSQKNKISLVPVGQTKMESTQVPVVVVTESTTVYEQEVIRKSKENYPRASHQLASQNNGDSESRFERDVSRNMASHDIKIVAVPQNPPPLPRINDLVVELSPAEIQKQQRQLVRQRSNKGGVLSKLFMGRM